MSTVYSILHISGAVLFVTLASLIFMSVLLYIVEIIADVVSFLRTFKMLEHRVSELEKQKGAKR